MRLFFVLSLIFSLCYNQENSTPSDYWESLTHGEKTAFVSGVFTATSRAKWHHQIELEKQYKGKSNWVPPYYIERYYEILDEHVPNENPTDLTFIVGQVDALYSNFDNHKIPLIEAIRIATVVEDGDRKKGNLLLLKAQQKLK